MALLLLMKKRAAIMRLFFCGCLLRDCALLLLLSVLLSPICSLYFLVLSRRAGLKSLPWVLLGALTGPLALPLFHNHKRMALRKALGHGVVWFKP